MHNMKKYIAGAALVLVIAGCSETAEEPATPAEQEMPAVEQPAPETVEPVESAKPEEAPLTTDENLEFDDDVTQFETWISQMASWQSYKATLDNYDNYFDETNIDTEYHEETEYVTVPFQLFKSTHRIGFSNDQMDRYIVENVETGELERVERFSFDEWQTVEDVEYYATNIAPARADMLQAMIDLSEERLLSEDGQTLTLNVLLENSKEAFKRLSMGVNFVTTEAELTEDIEGQLAMDESNVERVSAMIYSNGQEITGYDIDIYVNTGEPEQLDHYSYVERFSEMNTLEYTTTPEDL